jgi:hypothetical protein
MPHKRLTIAKWLVAYAVFMSAIVAGLLYGRQQALSVYGTPAAQAEWDAWREDASKMAGGPGPVKRRPPKSAEPPALKLMRDYFGICLTLAVVLSTVLFGTFAIFLTGALKQSSPP